MNLLRLALGFVAAALAGAGVAAAQPYIPIPDLVAPYLGVGEPGLYPGGSNAPTGAHLTYGQTRAAAVTPRDSAGNPDADGWIGLVYLGMSNCNQEGSRFEREADRFGEHAGRVVIVDAAKGGIDAFLMDEASDAYWTAFDQRLAAAGVDPDQVQVAWFENTQASEATSGNFPARIDALRAAYRGVILTLTARCPNLQLVFLTSRSWTPATARQTFAFETGFAMKGLIQDQMDDVDGLGSGPWLGWGPYTWADGPIPRADGFVWLTGDFEGDGIHPGPTAEWKVGNLLREHFRERELAQPWYLPPAPPVPPGAKVVDVRDALEDAVVDPAAPNTVSGATPTLAFDANRRIYLKFDLTALAGPVLHAKLSLLVDPVFEVSTSDLSAVANTAWSEATLTWNNAPAPVVPAIVRAPNSSRGGAWSADVTAEVEAARLAAAPAISFALAPVGAGLTNAAFLARESVDPPRLVLTLDALPTTLPIWSDGFESGDRWFWN